MPTLPTLVVYNPASSAGRTEKRWAELAPQVRGVLGPIQVHETQGPGDATVAVRDALRKQPHHVLCVGGDGTNHEVVNGFFEPGSKVPIAPEATFSFLVSGTGGDLGRTFPAAHDPDTLLPRIVANDYQPLDLIGCTYTADDDSEQFEFMVNIASLGMGGWVCRRVDRRPKGRLPAEALFFLTSLEALVKTQPFSVSVRVDDGEPRQVMMRNIVVANARFHGGGMEIAPNALTDDGELDLVISGAFKPLPMVWVSRLMYRGRAHEHPLINMERARRVEILPDTDDVFLEMDGEAMGRAPATFETLPGVLRAIL